jgi:hypothetical protein
VGLTAEQFNEWIERATPEALKYAAAILRQRGSMGPTLKIKPGRSRPRALEHGVEEEVLANVVLKLLEGDPPSYATTFQGAYPEDYPQFKTWLFTYLDNETRNVTRRERTKSRYVVSSDEDDGRVEWQVERDLARQYVDLKRQDRAERRQQRTLGPETALIEQTKQEALAESRLFEEDRTGPHIRQAEPVEYPDDVEVRDAPLDDVEARLAVLEDFPRTPPDAPVPATTGAGRPPKWTPEDAREMFLTYTLIHRTFGNAHDGQLARRPNESETEHRGRVAAMLLELDREWVQKWGPFGFSIEIPKDELSSDWEQGWRGYEFVYPILTEEAATEIARKTPCRVDSLARALVIYYRALSPATVKHVLDQGRALTPGAVLQRRSRP